MNIVFYSTNSNFFLSSLETQTLPSYKAQWNALCTEYPKHNFFLATQLPGNFLLDLNNKNKIDKSEKITYLNLEKETATEIAEEILSIKPDVAIAFSSWVTPYDWLPIKDSLIGDILNANGVKVLANTTNTCRVCFDKFQTHSFLKQNGYNIPNAVYVHHQMFWAERNNAEIKTNVYKEYIFSELQKLKFPVIAKNTVGLSSYGMEVLPTFKSLKAYLLSRKNSSDRLIEEYIFGEQFGCEIYGNDGKYSILEPFIFSVNQFGITSPKQSVKIGPVTNEKFQITELKKTLYALAKDLNISSSAEIDLVFSQNKWFIIEINPRVSGLSESYAVSKNKSLYKMALENMECKKLNDSDFNYVCNFKIPLLDKNKMEKVFALEYVKHVHQIFNKDAKQEREKGYTEIIIESKKNYSTLIEHLEEFKKIFPELVEENFLQKAKDLVLTIN